MTEPKKVITKDPDESLRYSFRWTRWLNGDTIADSSWTVYNADWSVPAIGLTKLEDTANGTVSTIKVSGGTPDATYFAVCRITTTTSEETKERCLQINIRDSRGAAPAS